MPEKHVLYFQLADDSWKGAKGTRGQLDKLQSCARFFGVQSVLSERFTYQQYPSVNWDSVPIIELKN